MYSEKCLKLILENHVFGLNVLCMNLTFLYENKHLKTIINTHYIPFYFILILSIGRGMFFFHKENILCDCLYYFCWFMCCVRILILLV